MADGNFRKTGGTALLAAIAAAYPIVGFGAPAARVDFTMGNVTAVGANGKSRALTRGAQVEQGETIATNNGRAQLRFTDGAYVSLQPQSEFRIDQYKFDGKQDGNEKGFFSLVKGGLRTITGLVGRNNKNNYQVTTSVATIGIRGTEYTIQYGQSVTGTVGEGEINVCNGAGCLSVMNGESYYVQNGDAKPVLTNKRTDLPPPEPNTLTPVYTAGDDQEQKPFVLTGTQVLNDVSGNFCDGACIGTGTDTTVVFDSAGNLTQFGSTIPAEVTMSGNDGIIAWGTFLEVAGSNDPVHFVAGVPVPTADLAALGGTVGTYSLLPGGATAVTDSSGNKIGTLDSATLNISFGASSSVTGSMNWTFDALGSKFASLSGSGSGSNLSVFGNCGGSCSVNGSVLLFGANAARAGMVYEVNDFNSLEAIGAAAFQKKP